ncbi:outer membrane beta-barrel protein [Taklimakanibacter lacteus]|uniref:outer membrane beta-barrel protein n=1 Tax=Taklimakanibacter lacteus TaxID=2268456 RepID=UPI000E66A092
MVRQRFIFCGIAAAFILTGVAQAQGQETQVSGLRASIDTPDPLADGDQADEEAVPPPIAARPTTLEAGLAVEPPPPPPRRRRREDDPYAALGLDVGGLTVFPVLRAGIIVSDNPASASTDRKGDIGARLRPSLRIASDWVRHELTVDGSGDFVFYDDQTENDSKAADIRARLRLDVLRSTTLALDVGYVLTQENGSDSEVPDTAIGNRTDQSFSQNVALTRRAGRFAATLRAGSVWRYFGDVDLAGGGKETNGDREYVEPQAAVRVSYEASPALKPYVEVGYAPRIHFEDRDRNGLNRNSDGYRIEAGVAFEPSPLWSGELGVDYMLRDYADPALSSIDIFGLTGRVAWRPSELTTVDLSLSTDLNETSSADSSGSRVYGARIGIAHDLRDHITLSGSAGVDYEDYQGSDETELTVRSNAGVLWRLNRWIAWTLDYDFIYNDSSLPESDDYENRLTAGIELRG